MTSTASLRNNLDALNRILRIDNITIEERISILSLKVNLVSDSEKCEIHLELAELYSDLNKLELAFVELDQAQSIVQSNKDKVIEILHKKVDIERRRQRLNRAEQLVKQIEKLKQ